MTSALRDIVSKEGNSTDRLRECDIDKGEGVQKYQIFAEFLFGWPLSTTTNERSTYPLKVRRMKWLCLQPLRSRGGPPRERVGGGCLLRATEVK